jgi:hypothetical protein
LRKGDISKSIENTARWRMFGRAAQAIKARHASIPSARTLVSLQETKSPGAGLRSHLLGG